MIMYFAFKTYPGGGAFALFFHPHPREFATQNKKSANTRGLARGGGGRWAQLELTDALASHNSPEKNDQKGRPKKKREEEETEDGKKERLGQVCMF